MSSLRSSSARPSGTSLLLSVAAVQILEPLREPRVDQLAREPCPLLGLDPTTGHQGKREADEAYRVVNVPALGQLHQAAVQRPPVLRLAPRIRPVPPHVVEGFEVRHQGIP